MNLIPIEKKYDSGNKVNSNLTWEVFLITSSNVGPMVPILCFALFALNFALSCAQRDFAKEATAKSPLHFLGLQWQLPPYYLLT
jgi:hypothetical protein